MPGSANVPAMKLGLDMVFETHGFCNCRLQKRGVFLVPESYRWEFIKQESAGVIDEKSLRTWDSEDVLAVYDALVRAHESINKLALVPESF